MATSFTEVEKRFVLAEMIKASGDVNLGILVDFIRQHELDPDWLSMQVPTGRNLHQCIQAVETMFGTSVSRPQLPKLKRKFFDDPDEHVAKRQANLPASDLSQTVALTSSLTSPGFGPPLIRPLPALHIQPRPSQNGYVPPLLASSTPSQAPLACTPTEIPSSSVSVPPARKRGRPSKSDLESRARPRLSGPVTFAPLRAAPIATQPLPLAPLPSPSTRPGELLRKLPDVKTLKKARKGWSSEAPLYPLLPAPRLDKHTESPAISVESSNATAALHRPLGGNDPAARDVREVPKDAG